MSEPTILAPPKGDLVAYLPCGCIGYACAADYVDMDGALELARCMMLGWRPGYLTTEQVRAAPWGCDVCKQQRADRALPVLATHDDATGDSPQWRVRGTVTFSIKFDVDGVVIAPTEDAALDALAENATALFFYGDDEKREDEWDDDELTVQHIEEGATPSQGGQRLPEGVEQLTLI